MRTQYWSCTKLADMIRGHKKPLALTLEQWEQWDKNSNARSSWRYWLAEEGLEIIQNIIYYPADVFNKVRSYVRNRFFTKIHYLPTRLTPGQYYDLDTRLLHACFESLVDFVEIEKAHMNRVFTPEYNRWAHWGTYRSKEEGLAYLDWEISLRYDDSETKPTRQAENAREVKELYLYWLERKSIPDPWTLDIPYDAVRALEDARVEKDDKMLTRLVAIRRGLWT